MNDHQRDTIPAGARLERRGSTRMHVLIIHDEARGFAGAEQMLLHFVDELRSGADLELTVAAVKDSKLGIRLPAGLRTIWVPEKSSFSLRVLWQQQAAIGNASGRTSFDLIHGWAARDWELTALVGRKLKRPALGTLHDHPRARFHGRMRRMLMRGAARYGLDHVVCVSQAVHDACLAAGYPAEKLTTIHNGLRRGEQGASAIQRGPALALGFLGVFSRRKGFRQLFEILDGLHQRTERPWEMLIAGQPQDDEGQALMNQVQHEFGGRPWWNRVQWLGWVKEPEDFFRQIQLLIVPSAEFDPFPTVLLEAGQSGVAAFASRRGGVGEIVADGKTGWLFEPDRCEEASELLAGLAGNPERIHEAGCQALARVRDEFGVGKMVAAYRRVYSTLAAND